MDLYVKRQGVHVEVSNLTIDTILSECLYRLDHVCRLASSIPMVIGHSTVCAIASRLSLLAHRTALENGSLSPPLIWAPLRVAQMCGYVDKVK